MNADDFVSALRYELRNLIWPGETLDATPAVTRRFRGEELDVVAYALDSDNAEAAIQEEISRSAGAFEWKAFSFDRPPDLLARLARAGFAIGEREAIVFYDLADGLTPFAGGSDVEVRRVERVEELVGFRAVAEAAFGKDYGPTVETLAEAIRTGARGHDAYVAYVGGVPASVGRLYTNPQSLFAGLYGGGTRPEFRRKGLYRAVVAARAQDAAATGVRYLMVDALPTSLPILQRMGFTHVTDTWPCASPPQ